jgi:hypothetical protein
MPTAITAYGCRTSLNRRYATTFDVLRDGRRVIIGTVPTPFEQKTRLRLVWEEAVQASALDRSQVHLLPVPVTAAFHEQTAVCYPPDVELGDEVPRLLGGAMLVEANSPEHKHKYRIAIEVDAGDEDPVSLAIFAGKLRHELRHAEQQIVCGAQLGQLSAFACKLVEWKVGGLPESGTLYNLMPDELDANAASAVFLREHYLPQVAGVLGSDHAVLALSKTAPGRLTHLSAKTVCFIFELREVAEEHARSPSGLSVRDRLGRIDRRWADVWDVLDRVSRL